MADEDDAKELLEKMAAELYARAAQDQVGQVGGGESYLIAADHQFLGKITMDPYDTQSITNPYGPFGSPYSGTSIFNAYSPYGSVYGQFSLNNAYSTTPPKLFLRGRFRGNVSVNEFVQDRIPTPSFLHMLRHNIVGLLRGDPIEDEVQARISSGEAFIQAADGTYLGSLNPNRFDNDSIFNKYGPYGSRFAQNAIFNKFGTYGGKFSLLSAFNTHSMHPPEIIHNGRRVAYLTVNTRLQPRVDPNDIFGWAERNVRKRL